MSDFNNEKAYNEAKKKLTEEKSFYMHLVVYIVMNLVIAFFKIKVGEYANHDNYTDWLSLNLILTPLVWGVVVLGHALWTFKRRSIKNKWFDKSIYGEEWEKRRIEEIMKKDNS